PRRDPRHRRVSEPAARPDQPEHGAGRPPRGTGSRRAEAARGGAARFRRRRDAVIPTPTLQFEPVLPELILVGVGIVALLLDALVRQTKPVTLLFLSLAGIAGAAAATLELWDWTGPQTVLGNTVAVDRFTVVARLVIPGTAAKGAIYGLVYFERSREFRGEFFALLLFATAGMTLITAAA